MYTLYKRPLIPLIACLLATALLAFLAYDLTYRIFSNGLIAEVCVFVLFLFIFLFSFGPRYRENPIAPACVTILIWLLFRLFCHLPNRLCFRGNLFLAILSLLLLVFFYVGAWYLIVRVAAKNRYCQAYSLATGRVVFLFAGQVLLANFLMRLVDGSLILPIF